MVLPHTSQSLVLSTALSKVWVEAAVGGSVEFALCRVKWTSLSLWLRLVVIWDGWIHFRDLQLGIAFGVFGI